MFSPLYPALHRHRPETGSHPSALAASQEHRYAHPIPNRPRSQGISHSRPLKPEGHLHSPEKKKTTTKMSISRFESLERLNISSYVGKVRRFSKLSVGQIKSKASDNFPIVPYIPKTTVSGDPRQKFTFFLFFSVFAAATFLLPFSLCIIHGEANFALSFCRVGGKNGRKMVFKWFPPLKFGLRRLRWRRQRRRRGRQVLLMAMITYSARGRGGRMML